MFLRYVISTGAVAERSEAAGEWRDLLLLP